MLLVNFEIDPFSVKTILVNHLLCFKLGFLIGTMKLIKPS